MSRVPDAIRGPRSRTETSRPGRDRRRIGDMSLWGRVFAAGYDKIMAGPEKAVLRGHRRSLLASARGRVLEIGGGTGANIPFYGPDVAEITIAEPEEPMARRLERK